jgi:uncharacterized membrane protein YcaP (DUF421 family)
MQLLDHLAHLDIPVLEKVIRPILVYFFLVVVLRLAGKRELAQINTFDLVVLLTLSNTVQNAIIGNDNSLFGGLVGASTLVAVNYCVVRFMYRHPLLANLLEGDADVLMEHGKVKQERLEREGITLRELETAAHRQGFDSLDAVDKATLEASGSISFISKVPSDEAKRHEEVLRRLGLLGEEIEALRRELKG